MSQIINTFTGIYLETTEGYDTFWYVVDDHGEMVFLDPDQENQAHFSNN